MSESTTLETDGTDESAVEHTDSGGSTGIPIRSSPTIRPSAVWLVLTLVVGIAATAYVSTNPGPFGDPDTANVVANAVVALTAVGVVRFLIRIVILTRTRYVVDADGITRQYSLLFQTRSRRVPHSRVRSHELRQSRIQKLLGYGTIAANQGLGEVELENVPDPHRVYRTLQGQID